MRLRRVGRLFTLDTSTKTCSRTTCELLVTSSLAARLANPTFYNPLPSVPASPLHPTARLPDGTDPLLLLMTAMTRYKRMNHNGPYGIATPP